MSTKVQIKYEGGCTSLALPEWFESCTLTHQKKFYKFMATWASDNREDVRIFRETLVEEIDSTKREIERNENTMYPKDKQKEADAELRRTKNRLKRLASILVMFDEAMEKYDYTTKRQGGK